MKTKNIKKSKIRTLSQSKKRAWEAFSKYVRLRDAIKTTGTLTTLACITCGKRYPAFGVGCAQAGHFIPGRGNSVLIDEDFVHGQCYNCNVNLRGNWIKYERAMIKMWGKEKVEEAKNRKDEVKIMKVYEWQALEELYKLKYATLINTYNSTRV
ncbi:MAG: hypothetical protein IFNCLDLE_02638 [Ignavibacteriaceae bacterium]|nr:hypothetical protein [Ignavibacteriaceae bacterium]